MACITLQIGQCGNQVGREWLTALATELQQLPNDLQLGAWEPFFRFGVPFIPLPFFPLGSYTTILSIKLCQSPPIFYFTNSNNARHLAYSVNIMINLIEYLLPSPEGWLQPTLLFSQNVRFVRPRDESSQPPKSSPVPSLFP